MCVGMGDYSNSLLGNTGRTLGFTGAQCIAIIIICQLKNFVRKRGEWSSVVIRTCRSLWPSRKLFQQPLKENDQCLIMQDFLLVFFSSWDYYPRASDFNRFFRSQKRQYIFLPSRVSKRSYAAAFRAYTGCFWNLRRAFEIGPGFPHLNFDGAFSGTIDQPHYFGPESQE